MIKKIRKKGAKMCNMSVQVEEDWYGKLQLMNQFNRKQGMF